MKGGGGQVELRKMALDEIPGIVIAQNGLVQKLFHPFRTVFLVQQAEHQRAAGGLIGGVGGGVQFLFRFRAVQDFFRGHDAGLLEQGGVHGPVRFIGVPQDGLLQPGNQPGGQRYFVRQSFRVHRAQHHLIKQGGDDGVAQPVLVDAASQVNEDVVGEGIPHNHGLHADGVGRNRASRLPYQTDDDVVFPFVRLLEDFHQGRAYGVRPRGNGPGQQGIHPCNVKLLGSGNAGERLPFDGLSFRSGRGRGRMLGSGGYGAHVGAALQYRTVRGVIDQGGVRNGNGGSGLRFRGRGVPCLLLFLRPNAGGQEKGQQQKGACSSEFHQWEKLSRIVPPDSRSLLPRALHGTVSP